MRRASVRRWIAGGVVVASCAVVAACGGDDSSSAGDDEDGSAGASENEAPESGADEPVRGDDWEVEAPEDHGMDPAVLEQAREYAFADGMNTQGVVVVRDGAIVAEWYGPGADEESWGASWSMAKSFTSALVGIAIEEGLIPSVDEPMTTYFPDWEGSERADMTLRDVLHMSSGLDWDEDYDPGAIEESEIIEMVIGQQDQLAYASGRPAEVEPGTRWSYSSGDTMLLSGVLEQATGMPVHEYAREKLFDPIGMAEDQVDWWRDAAGHTLTYCCLDTTSRGYARLGLLYLRDGRWADQQVVPSGWVEDSLEPVDASEGQYGYQWWLADIEGAPEDLFAAIGHDGQYIFVVPSLDLVVVRNGTYVKHPGEPVADPNLFEHYPPDGLVEGRGTSPPEADWDEADFLRPIVESIEGS